jgi:hypothetical protein
MLSLLLPCSPPSSSSEEGDLDLTSPLSLLPLSLLLPLSPFLFEEEEEEKKKEEEGEEEEEEEQEEEQE